MTKHFSKEMISKIREEVLKGKSKPSVARELGISDSAVYEHTKDIPSSSWGKPISRDLIQKIREEILKGKSKYSVAKEFKLIPETVYKYTKDLPNKYKREPYISGKPLELLKQLIGKGYVYTKDNGIALRSLQKHFPAIKRSQFKNKSIYYLEDKNKQALQEMMKQDTSRIISYQELGRMSKVFNTDLEIKQKRAFLGKNLKPRRHKIRKFKQQHQSYSKEKQSILDDFLGRFLHSELLCWFCVKWR